MRRLTKGKRRKSESPSDAESEANGGNVHTTEDAEQTMPNDDGESAPKSKRRASRGRDKSATEEIETIKDNDDEQIDEDLPKQENGNSDKGGEKRRKKEKEGRKPTTSQENNNSDQEYEVY